MISGGLHRLGASEGDEFSDTDSEGEGVMELLAPLPSPAVSAFLVRTDAQAGQGQGRVQRVGLVHTHMPAHPGELSPDPGCALTRKEGSLFRFRHGGGG
jgi:hypothetical protein